MSAGSRGSIVNLMLAVKADLPLPDGLTERSLQSLALFALDEERSTGDWEVNLLFTSDATIRGMHVAFMGRDSPTDIMTFPYEGDGFSSEAWAVSGGDIVISVETASSNATDAGWRLEDELEFLLLHGLLHILGWDDGDAGARSSMLARQSVLLAEWRAQASGART